MRLLGGVTRADQSAAISMRTRNLGQQGVTDAESMWRRTIFEWIL